MQHSLKDISVVIPAYNENPIIIEKTREELERLSAEVVVVDDGSTNQIANAIRHGNNHGYGAALMTGIRNASNDIVLCMDGDGQHTVRDAVNLVEAYRMINCDMLIGKRRPIKEAWYRYIARKAINWTASLFATYWLPDLNSGMRIFKRSRALGYFPILCRKFSFTTSLTLSMICDNLWVEWFPIDVQERAHGKSRVKYLKDGLVTLWYILYIGIGIRTRGIRAWYRKLIKK